MKTGHRRESEDCGYYILRNKEITGKRLLFGSSLLTCITVAPGKRITDKKTPQPFFGREHGHLIKGVAIIMLILHHLFLFPSTNPWFTSIIGTR